MNHNPLLGKMKITIVYGTRPEILKLIPVIRYMKTQDAIELIIINAGQHKNMVSDIEKQFNINPDFILHTMEKSQSLVQLQIKISELAEPLLLKIKPDLVLIQGDTATVATVGMICFYNKIAVAHVEAGLRSFNLDEPFPEEFNRRIISLFSTFNFAPTKLSANYLQREGIAKEKIFITGNTIVDMINIVKDVLPDIKIHGKKNILITAHRRENHEKGILNVCKAVKEILKDFSDITFTWPVHMNPNVTNVVYKELSHCNRVRLCDPLDYLALSALIKSSYLIWTDSGGIQEEAPSYKKPVLILRNVTERPEVIDAGFGKLIGTDTNTIIKETKRLLLNTSEYEKMTEGENPFGDGDAARKITHIILDKFFYN